MTTLLHADVAPSFPENVIIRPVTNDDTNAVAALLQRISDDSFYMRFFSLPSLSVLRSEVRRLTRPASRVHAAVVAEISGVIVGVASYERRDETDPTAEPAVIIDDAHHGQGIGTRLVIELLAQAHRDGVSVLRGFVLPGNVRMLRMTRRLAGTHTLRLSDRMVEIVIPTTDETGC